MNGIREYAPFCSPIPVNHIQLCILPVPSGAVNGTDWTCCGGGVRLSQHREISSLRIHRAPEPIRFFYRACPPGHSPCVEPPAPMQRGLSSVSYTVSGPPAPTLGRWRPRFECDGTTMVPNFRHHRSSHPTVWPAHTIPIVQVSLWQCRRSGQP